MAKIKPKKNAKNVIEKMKNAKNPVLVGIKELTDPALIRVLAIMSVELVSRLEKAERNKKKLVK